MTDTLFSTSLSAYSGRMRFDGPDLTAQDEVKLTESLQRAYDYLSDGEWHLLADMAQVLGLTEQGASARIRDLRKERFGRHTIKRERVGRVGRVYRYKLVLA